MDHPTSNSPKPSNNSPSNSTSLKPIPMAFSFPIDTVSNSNSQFLFPISHTTCLYIHRQKNPLSNHAEKGNFCYIKTLFMSERGEAYG